MAVTSLMNTFKKKKLCEHKLQHEVEDVEGKSCSLKYDSVLGSFCLGQSNSHSRVSNAGKAAGSTQFQFVSTGEPLISSVSDVAFLSVDKNKLHCNQTLINNASMKRCSVSIELEHEVWSTSAAS